ncbi:MAG: hypothetical protein IPN95_16465 [Bacteroidetes bacterium]|nr:hypothetical protein [Bacteroidota bacterium]
MRDHAADVLRAREALVRPGFARVARAVHAHARVGAAAAVAFAGANPDDVGLAVETAMSPMPIVPCSSKIGENDMPLLVVFHPAAR